MKCVKILRNVACVCSVQSRRERSPFLPYLLYTTHTHTILLFYYDNSIVRNDNFNSTN